jgi:hypothetical protein
MVSFTSFSIVKGHSFINTNIPSFWNEKIIAKISKKVNDEKPALLLFLVLK